MLLPHSHLFLQLLAWVIAAPWIAKFFESAFGLPRVPDLLQPQFDRPTEASIAVIIPARNEAAGIRSCVKSLLAQDAVNLRIIAVDDRSTDATGAIIDDFAASHPSRFKALHVTDLPPNWLGKTHAMAVAARAAVATEPPDFLLFTDGDVVFAPTILRRSLAYAVSTGADHLVTLPTTLTRTPGESLLLAFLQVFSLFAVRPWLAHRPKCRDAFGVGAFNLIRTGVYLQLGGFEALATEIVEDLALGTRVKSAGFHQRAAYAPGAVSLHWAPGLLGILHGLTKNLFAVFRFRSSLLLGAAFVVIPLWIGPWYLLFPAATRPPAALSILSLAGLYTLVGRRSLISPLWFPTAPFAAALLVYSMLRSMFVTLRDGGVTWRGTFYPISTLRSPIKGRS